MSGDDPNVRELWQRVVDHWDDEKAHTGFIEYCRRTQQLAACAARYKGEATADGAAYRSAGHEEAARKRLAAIAILAVAELSATRSDRGEQTSSLAKTAARWAVMLVILATLGLMLLGLLTR